MGRRQCSPIFKAVGACSACTHGSYNWFFRNRLHPLIYVSGLPSRRLKYLARADVVKAEKFSISIKITGGNVHNGEIDGAGRE